MMTGNLPATEPPLTMSRLNKITFLLVCGTVILTTLGYGTVHQPIIAFFYVLVAAAVIIWAADCFIGGAVRVSTSVLQLPLLLLGVYALIQIIPFGTLTENGGLAIPRTISTEPFATLSTAFHIFALSAFFACALVSLDSAARLRRIVTVLSVFGFVYAFYAILQSVLSPDKIYGIYDPRAGTLFGSFVNRHDFAAVIEMLIALPAGLVFAGAVAADKRLLYGVAIALMGSSLLLSGSRGGLIALFAEVAFLVILTSRSSGRKRLVLRAGLSAALVLAAFGGAIVVGGDTSLTRFAESTATGDISSSRFEIWRLTLIIIIKHLPFGAGLGAFPQAFAAVDPSGGAFRVDQAHNDYLQILADAGVVGLVIGGLFLYWFFRQGFRSVSGTNPFRRGVAAGAFAGCVGILVHSLFDFVLHITAISVMFLTLIAILVASGREYADDMDESDDRPSRRRPASVTAIDERRTLTQDRSSRT